ncbi:MAG: hypothetical protein AAFO29_05335 [Actinomycetota bacterium]
MPVAQGGPPPARQAMTVGVAALLGLLAVVFLVTRFDNLGGGGQTQVELGGQELPVGPAAEVAPAVADTGPLLFPGPEGAGRDIFLQHLGPGDTEGWVAFSARADDAGLDCVVEWQPVDETFVDSCDGTIFPADGAGLIQYPVAVDADGNLTLSLIPLP